MAVLADGEPRTHAELRRQLPALEGATSVGAGRQWGQGSPVGPRLLTVMLARGQLLRGPSTGPWMQPSPTWVSAASWLGAEIPPIEPATARRDLVRAWLGAFGPGTDADIAWWLGDTLTNVRAALDAIGAAPVALDDGSGWVLADDVDEVDPVEPWAALLPALDPATMGWKGRDWYLGPHRAELFDRAGNGGASAWWDGRIVGAWHQLHGPDVEVVLLEDIGSDAGAALDAEAARLTGWLAGDRPGGRWVSPVVSALKRSGA
jgi:hypothetical protein